MTDPLDKPKRQRKPRAKKPQPVPAAAAAPGGELELAVAAALGLEEPAVPAVLGPDPYGRIPEFRDFRNVMFHIWVNVGLPAPTELQNDTALWLQHGPKRRMLKGFRGMAKSWMT